GPLHPFRLALSRTTGACLGQDLLHGRSQALTLLELHLILIQQAAEKVAVGAPRRGPLHQPGEGLAVNRDIHLPHAVVAMSSWNGHTGLLSAGTKKAQIRWPPVPGAHTRARGALMR